MIVRVITQHRPKKNQSRIWYRGNDQVSLLRHLLNVEILVLKLKLMQI